MNPTEQLAALTSDLAAALAEIAELEQHIERLRVERGAVGGFQCWTGDDAMNSMPWNLSAEVENRLESVARDEALLSQEAHGYLPKTPEEAAKFNPHEWVLEAMRRAYAMGRTAGAHSAAKSGSRLTCCRRPLETTHDHH